jgi:hypothetical protein
VSETVHDVTLLQRFGTNDPFCSSVSQSLTNRCEFYSTIVTVQDVVGAWATPQCSVQLFAPSHAVSCLLMRASTRAADETGNST